MSQAKSSNDEGRKALYSLMLTIVIPTIILSKFSGVDSLGIKKAILVAFAFPLFYGIYEFRRDKKVDFIAVLGLLNVLLSGGFTLLGKDWSWIAAKEAVIPVLIGVFVILSHKWGSPLVKTLFLNPAVVDVKQIEKGLAVEERKPLFDKLLFNSSLMLSGTFVFSAGLNYALAWYLLHDKAPESEAFNASIGTMNWAGFLVIGIPMMIVLMLIMFRYFFPSLARLLGVEMDDLTNPGKTVRRTVSGPGDDSAP